MDDLKYPIQLTPAHWAKNKGQLAKAKPTGIGDALTKLQKAHDELDLSLFDTAKLATAEAVAKVLASYEREAKKKFVKAFEEAKTAEGVATDAAVVFKKSTLIPKSAREAAEAVAKAASDYAVALTSVRQTGLAALQKLQENLEKAEAKQKDSDDEDDENAPAQVIAERVARKVTVALKAVKANQGDLGKPAQRFLIAAVKAGCAVYMGPRAGTAQKGLLKAMLGPEGGPPKFYEGECLWEHEAYTFVGDNIPLGGFARRVQKALQAATTKKLKIRIRHANGESEEADDIESTIPEAPPLPPGGSTTPPTVTAPRSGESDGVQVVKQRLKLLMPKLEKLLLLPGQPGADAKLLRDAIKQKAGANDFAGAVKLLDALDKLAVRNGITGETATKTPADPQAELKKERLLDQVDKALASVLGKANGIAGTPKYKAAYLRQHQKMLNEMTALKTIDARFAGDKLEDLLARVQALDLRLDPALGDPSHEKKKEELLGEIEKVLTSIDNKAKGITGSPSPKYKTAYVEQHKKMQEELEALEALDARVATDKKLANLLSRAKMVETRVTTASVDGPDAQSKLDTWATKTVVDLENSIKAPAGSDDLRQAMAPVLKAMRARIAQAQRLIDGGEFAKAVEITTSIYFEVERAATTISEHATKSPAYAVERNKALQAIAALKRHTQKDAIAAEIQAIETQLEQIDTVITAARGWTKATSAVALIEKQCAMVLKLANRLKATEDLLPDFNRRMTEAGDDPATATRLAGYAHKLLVEENCDSDAAVQMARDVNEFVATGLSERDALVSARVCKAMKDEGIDPAKAKRLGRVLRAGGSSTADDAKAVAKLAARMSEQVLDNLIANGIPIESFRGGVTEVAHSSIGEIPRGWERMNKTWDHVPGMYDKTVRKVLVGTMDDSGDRKVPGKFESAGMVGGVSIDHGTDDLVGHEAGHAFDVSDGDTKNKNAEFRAARLRDIAAGNLVKRAVPVPPTTTPPTPKAQPADTARGIFVTRDDYFVVASEAEADETNAGSGSQADLDAACSETFAESFAMHFAGTSRWPELEQFWQSNPWGV